MHEATQNSAQLTLKTPKKRRTQAEKVGRLEYIIRSILRLERRVKRIDSRTRLMEKGLQDFMIFEKDYVAKVVCRDEVDEDILQRLLEVGDNGLLPSELAASLQTKRLKRWDVTRRIQRMNKKLQGELGQNVAEKRGHHWAMSSFMRSVFSATVKEAREEGKAAESMEK
jgi:hypothetical protein